MKKEVDLCIVGGAGAGLTAAVYARQRGVKNVLVLEKMKRMGGCTLAASGLFAVDSPVQKRRGLYYNPDKLYKDLMQVYNWKADGRLVRKWITGSGENIRWLEELGMTFDDVNSFASLKENAPSTYHRAGSPSEPPRTGKEIIRILKAEAERLGVKMMTETRAGKLLVEDGCVIGVMATTADGETLEVQAKAVLLAMGSISANRELVSRFFDEDVFSKVKIMANMPHNTGDGFLMAEKIGAAVGELSVLYIGPHNHFPDASEITGTLMRRPQVIKINKNGERYVDESIPTSTPFGWFLPLATDRQPGRIVYCIFDRPILEDMKAKRETYSMVDLPMVMPDTKEEEYSSWFDMIEEAMIKEEAAGRAKICATIEEAAAYIECEAETLRAEIDMYNEDCSLGYDRNYVKDPRFLQPLKTPPYYVLNGPSGIDTCLGGVLVDSRQRVIDKEKKPIKGLYAAGVVTSGWLSGGYAFYGGEMSYTIFSGRNAAEEIAKNIQGVNPGK